MRCTGACRAGGVKASGAGIVSPVGLGIEAAVVESRDGDVRSGVGWKNGGGSSTNACWAAITDDRTHDAVQPPSTTMVWPVMLRAGAEIRNATMPAISSMPMKARFGMGLSMISLTTWP